MTRKTNQKGVSLFQMLNRIEGCVTRIVEKEAGREIITVETPVGERMGINYPALTGSLSPGDLVLLNSTAVDLGLGTGGYDFVMAILTPHAERRKDSNREEESGQWGGVIKGRYTPYQLSVHGIEEENHPLYSSETRMGSLHGSPILIFSLHSMLPVAASLLHEMNPALRILYIMTDSAALPIWLSDHVAWLKEEGIIQGTITSGQAFGGDAESVNQYTALLAAKHSLGAEAILIGPGPGVVGTGHPFGTSAMEIGELVNAVHILNGESWVIPRIQTLDPRKRHLGLSHHITTALSKIALARAILPLPRMGGALEEMIRSQIEESRLEEKHEILWSPPFDLERLADLFRNRPIKVMGREILSDPPYLHGIAAATLAYLERIV